MFDSDFKTLHVEFFFSINPNWQTMLKSRDNKGIQTGNWMKKKVNIRVVNVYKCVHVICACSSIGMKYILDEFVFKLSFLKKINRESKIFENRSKKGETFFYFKKMTK